MMVFSKVLACFLLLAGLSAMTTSRIQISNSCLLKICHAASSENKSGRNVSSRDVRVINALLGLLPSTEDKFYCSHSDISQYSNLIDCNCNRGTCRVTFIDFSNMKLKGPLPDVIGDLTHLNFLDLSGNELSGLIPGSLVNLKQLFFLDLCYNNLEGPIPPFNGKNKALEELYLCSNKLNGSIPQGLGELSSLQYLYLRYNALNGTIPHEIWNIKSLEELELQDNQFEGQLPEQLENLRNLSVLFLMNNNFSGELPKSIGELTNLVDLSIRGCNFNGTIPDVIYQLPKLETLGLPGNNFKGPLPKAFSSKNLTSIYINDIQGDEKGYPFPDLRSLTNLELLILRNCSLVGPIPPEIWHMPNLSYLDLSFNNLSGEIPLALDVQKFTSIFLRSNKLHGLLPVWASNSNGINVDVSENLFTVNYATFPRDTIPHDKNLFACCSNSSDEKNKWLDSHYRCANNASLNDHLHINCGGNGIEIEGNYYEADLDPHGISTFVLSNNSAWGYSSMGKFLTLDEGEKGRYILNETCNISMVDAPLYTGARVAPISLKYYGFCLRNGEYSVRLDFAEIGWDSNKDNYNPVGKRVFNVDIQGKRELGDFNIEEAAEGLDKNVSRNFTTNVIDNRLEIHFYWSGKGSVWIPKYYGPLISAIAISAVPKSHHKLSPVSIGAIVGSSFIFVGLIVILFWMFGWLGGKKPNKDGVELYPGGVFNFQEIKTATNNFDITKKIGETGSVYQGVLADGIEVAVKQLFVKSKQEAHQIINEIGIIYALQHPNIAKPMGCCFKERQVLLVYKYMENLSLQQALFGSDDVRQKLNWRTRFKICLGIAKGLAFLHEESKLDIIHSNIKPTNILLDKDFNVKISDFRYSEFHDGQLNKQETAFHNMRRAKDTGHMAPEYMQGLSITPKADVYSFGLVTLEIIGGQPDVIVKPKEDILLLNTAHKYYEEGILEALIDTSLPEHKDYKHHEVVSILYLAMQCVSPSFDLRPTMSEVVQIFEGKKKLKGRRINPTPMIEPVAPPSQSIGSGSTSQEGSSTINVSDSHG